jgi:hypothetical protein
MGSFYQSSGPRVLRIDAERETIYTAGMNRLILIAVTLAFLGACSSGSGCDGGGDKKPSSGQSSSLSGGAGSSRGTSETVSFQGLGRKAAGDPAQAAASAPTAAAAAALGGGGAPAPAASSQSVICGGFPYLAADCKTDPVYDQIVKKCCPAGQVDQCQAIPGGARLIGHGCTASNFTSVPTAASAN